MVHFPLLNQALKHPDERPREVKPLVSEINEAVKGIAKQTLSAEQVQELKQLAEKAPQLKLKSKRIRAALKTLFGEVQLHPAWHGAALQPVADAESTPKAKSEACSILLQKALKDGYDKQRESDLNSLYGVAFLVTTPLVCYAFRPRFSASNTDTTVYAALQSYDGWTFTSIPIEHQLTSKKWKVTGAEETFSSLNALLKKALGKEHRLLYVKPPASELGQQVYRSGQSYVQEKHLDPRPIIPKSSAYGTDT